MNTDTRAGLLAAFREIHDGRWERNVGTDGGRSLLWEGRVVVIGAVTTAWDKARDVISTMGDRFVLVRLDSYVGRLEATQRARRNVGEEVAMRAELARVVAGLLSTVPPDHTLALRADEERRLTEAANLVTLARTGVDYDFRGDVIDAHAPEMPTRFVKQLFQLMRGATALGMPRGAALRLAHRCARDSMPPLRLALLDDVAAHPDASTRDVRTRLNKPRTTVDRQLQALHFLGVLICREEVEWVRGEQRFKRFYSLADTIRPDVLDPDVIGVTSSPDLPPHVHTDTKIKKEENGESGQDGHSPESSLPVEREDSGRGDFSGDVEPEPVPASDGLEEWGP